MATQISREICDVMWKRSIENMYSVFPLSYTNTRESLGELEKALETLASPI